MIVLTMQRHYRVDVCGERIEFFVVMGSLFTLVYFI